MCRLPGYRDSVLTAMRGLQALDGWDRCGKAANDDDSIQDIPGLESYMEFLMSSTSSELSRVNLYKNIFIKLFTVLLLSSFVCLEQFLSVITQELFAHKS